MLETYANNKYFTTNLMHAIEYDILLACRDIHMYIEEPEREGQ